MLDPQRSEPGEWAVLYVSGSRPHLKGEQKQRNAKVRVKTKSKNRSPMESDLLLPVPVRVPFLGEATQIETHQAAKGGKEL